MTTVPPSLELGVILRALAGAISDVVVVLDRDGRYRDIISRRGELLVRPGSELLHRTIHEFFPPETTALFLRWIRQALDSGRPVEGEYEVDLAGHTTWFAASVSPLTADTVIWVARDVTQRKGLEAQLRQAVKMEAVGRLAGGVAHDFNNLLTAIVTNADLALSGLRDMRARASAPHDGDARDVEEELGQIKRAAERAAALTRQLLAFSRKQMLQPSVMRLDDAVREAGELLARLIGEDVQLQTHLDDDTWPVVADAGQLTQVVMNLAVNARDAMPDGGVLTITTGNLTVTESLAARHRGLDVGDYVVLTMRDTGTGMDQATKERVFEPFFTTKRVGKGTGLGLATVYGIVRQSSGHIELASAPGRGTAFWIFLPRAHQDAPVKLPATVRTPARATSGATVLVVEDEPQVRGAAARVLRRAGYLVLEAGNGVEALDLWAVHGQDIALVVTDVVMPQLGGRELVRRLRADGAMVPVLFVSGYAEGTNPERSDVAGRSAFLPKPFEIADLVRLAGDLIGGQGATRPSRR